ncbi:MAG TPA: N-acetylneuraminate synthase family protein [bacterium]|nr:N-acetylneuraminate synthase family protein [bacterium]
MTNCPEMRLGKRCIGGNHPCYIIAEAGINHNGSMEMARRLVDAARETGADAVKFQMRNLHHCYPGALLKDPNIAEWGFHHILSALKDADFGADEFRMLREYCIEKEIEFLCTPWDISSLNTLESMNVSYYKISSADLVNLPLIDAVAATGKPMILSTGMATEKEIERTVRHLKAMDAEFALLHCVSAYPAPFESLNLRYITVLQQYGVPVGYSGHERGISVPVVARVLGACIIEKHITLDRTLPGPDHATSLEPYGFKKMVRDIRVAETALGQAEKSICQIEQVNRHVLRKSLVAARDISAGETITSDMVKAKGPGKGISPQRIEELIGVVVQRDISHDDYFVEGDLLPEELIPVDKERFTRKWGFKARFHDLDEIVGIQPDFIELHLSEHDVRNGVPEINVYPATDLYIHAPEFFNGRLLDLGSEDVTHRHASAEILRRVIELSEKLAVRFRSVAGIIVHAGGMTLDEPVRDTDRILERIIDEMRRLIRMGPDILPENLPPRPWYLGGQWFQNVLTLPEDLLRLHGELNCQITFDLCHAQLACTVYERSLTDYIDTVMPVTRHVHLSDASGIDGEGLQVDEGIIDWPETLLHLRRHQFTWVPEIWSGHLNRASGFRLALQRLVNHGGL